jgi:hypothetical protein
MNREDVIRSANEAGMIAKPCASEEYIAIRAGEAEDTNERMRLTEDGQVLVVDEGYYWQVGTVEDVANAIRARGESK